jgi:hypothetical protein
MELTSHFAALKVVKTIGNEAKGSNFGYTDIHPFFTKINLMEDGYRKPLRKPIRAPAPGWLRRFSSI